MKRLLHLVARPGLLALVFVCCLLLYGGAIAWITYSTTQTNSRLDLQEAKVQAQEAAAHQAEVTVCRRQVVTAPTNLAILASVKALIEARVQTARDALEADPGSPLAQIRRETIAEGLTAIAGLNRLVRQTKRQTPTAERCDRLARKYGIQQGGK